MHILVLESSTTSAKAMICDPESGAAEVRSHAYRKEDGSAEGKRDAEAVFLETVRLGRELAAGKEVAAIALSCAWHSLMLCSREMKPVTPVYAWSNTEASGLCAELREDGGYTKDYYQKTGCMVNAIYPFFKLKYLAAQGYRLSDYAILGQGTYNNYRLTGEWVVTDSVASGSGLMDVHTKTYDETLLDDLGIAAPQLGRIISYRQTLALSKEGAGLLGLTPGLPVVASMPDGALNQAGSGALAGGIMTLSVGTSGALRLAVPRPVLPDTPSTWCYLGPDTWLSGAATSGCCNCVDWFKGGLGGGASYAKLDDEARRAGGETPVFLPFLFGERCPGWLDGRTGGFLRVKPSHTRGCLYRAVLEGVLFNLYQCYEALCLAAGAPEKIRLSGGIANSPFWTQMCADVFRHEMELDDAVHASMAGGARLARRALGDTGALDDIEPGIRKRVQPGEEAAGLYRDKYARYLECYYST